MNLAVSLLLIRYTGILLLHKTYIRYVGVHVIATYVVIFFAFIVQWHVKLSLCRAYILLNLPTYCIHTKKKSAYVDKMYMPNPIL